MKRTANLILVTLGAALLTPVALAQQAGTTTGQSATGTSTTSGWQGDAASAQTQTGTTAQDMRSESDMSGLGMDSQDQATDAAHRPTGSSGSSAMDRATGHAPPTATTGHAGTQSTASEHALWSRLDTNRDGRISMEEGRANATIKADFRAMDANRDGYISDAEYRSYSDRHAGMGMDTSRDKAAHGTKDADRMRHHANPATKGSMDETRSTDTTKDGSDAYKDEDGNDGG